MQDCGIRLENCRTDFLEAKASSQGQVSSRPRPGHFGPQSGQALASKWPAQSGQALASKWPGLGHYVLEVSMSSRPVLEGPSQLYI